MFHRTFWTVACMALLAPMLTITTRAGNPALLERLELREVPRIPETPRPHANGDGIAPTPWGGLAGDTRRPNPQPGVVWAPGAPGSGGGTGGEPEAQYGDTYLVLSELELYCPSHYSGCDHGVFNDSATLIGGAVRPPSFEDPARGCTLYPSYAAVYELDDEARVVATHELPRLDSAGTADYSNLTDINDEGVVLGSIATDWSCEDQCNCREWQQIVWQPQPGGGWLRVDVPEPSSSLTFTTLSLNNAGWILGRSTVDVDGDGAADRLDGIVWRPDPGEPGGYQIERLTAPGAGPFADPRAFPSRLADSGLVVGTAKATADAPEVPVAWQREPTGEWLATEVPNLGPRAPQDLAPTKDGSILGLVWQEVLDEDTGELVTRRRFARWTRNPSTGAWQAPELLGIEGAGDQALVLQDGSDFVVGEATLGSHGGGADWSTYILEDGAWSPLGPKLGQQWDPYLEDMAGHRWMLIATDPAVA